MATIFRFRLERLLGLRRARAEEAGRDLARAQQEARLQNEAMVRLLREEEEGKEALRALRLNALDLPRLRLHEGYLEFLARRIRVEHERLQERIQAEIGKRRALAAALRAVQVLERLRERRERTHRVEMERLERGLLDEAAQNLATRA
jgi:flagellar export protein FliJ